jgi:preprotein translocase subunit SecD
MVVSGCADPGGTHYSRKSANIEFRIVALDNETEADSIGRKDGHEKVRVKKEVIVAKGDIDSATVSKAETGGYEVAIELTEAAGVKMREVTSKNIHRQMAIIINGEVISSPHILVPIDRRLVIYGGFTKEEAKEIAIGLTN